MRLLAVAFLVLAALESGYRALGKTPKNIDNRWHWIDAVAAIAIAIELVIGVI